MTWTWSDVQSRLAAEPDGTRLRLPRSQVEHPLDGGLVRAVDLPVGQRADFRTAAGERTLCVQDFGSHYEAFFVAPAPAPDLAAPVADDPAAAAGALFALLLAGTREATLVGALLGAALGRRRG
jgi:hypothetical protein